MGNENIELARQRLSELEKLRLEEAKLKQKYDYLPKEYNDDEVKKQIDLIEDEILKYEEIKEKIERLNESGELKNTDISYENLDKIILELEQLNLKRDNYEKYKNLNSNMQRIFMEAILSVTDARNDVFSEIFIDSLGQNESIETFINMECLRNEKIAKPFMVALLTMDPNEIYAEIINGARSLNANQKQSVATYIEYQKKRINNNLILSDQALINLLETNTGRNIVTEEQINDRYKFYCDKFCYEKFNMSMLETIISHTYSVEYIISVFSDILEYKKLSDVDKQMIRKRIEYSFSKTPAQLMQEKEFENRRLFTQGDKSGKKHNLLLNTSNKIYSINGERINRFSENRYGEIQFLRTIDDMRISNFPTSDVENYVFETFSSNKVPREFKQNLIAIAIDNLKLCYDLFKNYYKTNSINITTYLNMSSGDQIELEYTLGEKNIPHILGIPPTNKYNEKEKQFTGIPQLPKETTEFLKIKNASALNVLEAILENRDRIIENCGCVRGRDGLLYEMLPWEKIILKANAFIRGDFFKTTSYISGLNPLSYMMTPTFDKDGNIKKDVNAVSLNSTLFNRSAINQQPINVFENSPLVQGEPFARRFNTNLERDKDYILKGLIVQYNNDRIKRIDAVKTNESFIGQRIKTQDGIPVRSLNKMLYMLQNVNPEQGGIVTSVENILGQKQYSIDEMILLLEDMALSFENNQNVIDMVKVVISQIQELNNSISKSRR